MTVNLAKVNPFIFLFPKVYKDPADYSKYGISPHDPTEFKLSKIFASTFFDSDRVSAVYMFNNGRAKDDTRWYLSENEVDYLFGDGYYAWYHNRNDIHPFIGITKNYEGNLTTTHDGSFDPPLWYMNKTSAWHDVPDFLLDNKFREWGEIFNDYLKTLGYGYRYDSAWNLVSSPINYQAPIASPETSPQQDLPPINIVIEEAIIGSDESSSSSSGSSSNTPSSSDNKDSSEDLSIAQSIGYLLIGGSVVFGLYLAVTY